MTGKVNFCPILEFKHINATNPNAGVAICLNCEFPECWYLKSARSKYKASKLLTEFQHKRPLNVS